MDQSPPDAVMDRSIEFAPIADIPWPKLAPAESADPISALMNDTAFGDCVRFFADCPSSTRALLGAEARALLYSTIRNFRPDHVVEIGSYKGGTTEALARALHANGHGIVHTIGPFDVERFSPLAARWPAELRQRMRYHPTDSMAFFMLMDHERIRPGIVLVDGDHSYEFASFDIRAVAQRLQPGGFIFIDNVDQAGPYFATKDFLAQEPDWTICGKHPWARNEMRAFDRGRSNIPGTAFFILQAPTYYPVGSRPKSFGMFDWSSARLNGVKLSLMRPPGAGILHIECVSRAFSEAGGVELASPGRHAFGASDSASEVEILLTEAIEIPDRFDHYNVEPWLAWSGDEPLALNALPVPF
jgi:predicted O-methyltransferase YrrM